VRAVLTSSKAGPNTFVADLADVGRIHADFNRFIRKISQHPLNPRSKLLVPERRLPSLLPREPETNDRTRRLRHNSRSRRDHVRRTGKRLIDLQYTILNDAIEASLRLIGFRSKLSRP